MARRIITLLFLFLLSIGSTLAYSGFPGAYYPGNQWGHGASYYQGPWGEVMVYGAHGYFPNPSGYRPYGVRQYGHVYTVWDIRTGRAMRGW